MEKNYEFTFEIANRNIEGYSSYFNYDAHSLDQDIEYQFGKSQVKVFLDIDHSYDLQGNGIWSAKVSIKRIVCLLSWELFNDGTLSNTGTIQIDTDRQLNQSQWTIKNNIEFKPDGAYLIENITISLDVNDPIIELY
ncbi:MAG: hypothetical protein ABIP51_23750 [Bacteroidia bacterium]